MVSGSFGRDGRKLGSPSEVVGVRPVGGAVQPALIISGEEHLQQVRHQVCLQQGAVLGSARSLFILLSQPGSGLTSSAGTSLCGTPSVTRNGSRVVTLPRSHCVLRRHSDCGISGTVGSRWQGHILVQGTWAQPPVASCR